ncbi:helix-turn-helix transcriptional regulator [Billgrantia antri]|uniref:helix-turn-helix transcriptional regulator n=1 Tax=Billgrantia antri TaxID=2846777 RepID=UPI003B213ABE
MIETYPTKPVLLRRPEVLRRCGISNSTLHRLIKADDFPTPVQLSPRAVAWVESEISQWIEHRIETNRTTSQKVTS